VVKGAASAARIAEQVREISARAIRGNRPPEEGAAMSNSSRGPGRPERTGVAATDGRRFKSCTAHHETSRLARHSSHPLRRESLTGAMNTAKLQPIEKVGAVGLVDASQND